MAIKGPLEGIAKWLERDEWREAFGAAVTEHIGEACAAAEIEPEDIPEMIDEDAHADLMHCILFDFMTRRIGPDQRNIVTDYLKRRGWKEPILARRMLEALRNSSMSLYEISGVVPGKSFLARDMISGGEPVRVNAEDIIEDLHQWDRIGVRLIPRNGQIVPGGPVLIYSHAASDALAERLTSEAEGMALKALAPLFTEAWLDEQLEEETEPELSDLADTDGAPPVFHTVRYPLAAGAGADAVRARLDGCAGLRAVEESAWDWMDGEAALGLVEVTDTAVSLETNSEANMRRGRDLLAALLDGLVGEPEVSVQTAEEVLKSLPEQLAKLAAQFSDEAIGETLDQVYRAALDEPIPMLGDASPRTAAQSAEGRRKIVAWLKYLENAAEIERAAGEGLGYDFGWMWSELGVADLRR